MANKTTNLELTKPLASEFYDIGVFNNNADIIDTAVTADRARLTTLEGKSYDLSGDVITGKLPINKGGTNATSAADARTSLGITPANIGAAETSHTHAYGDLSGVAASSHKHAAADITSGILAEARGGTGVSDLDGGLIFNQAGWLSTFNADEPDFQFGTAYINANATITGTLPVEAAGYFAYIGRNVSSACVQMFFVTGGSTAGDIWVRRKTDGTWQSWNLIQAGAIRQIISFSVGKTTTTISGVINPAKCVITNHSEYDLYITRDTTNNLLKLHGSGTTCPGEVIEFY